MDLKYTDNVMEWTRKLRTAGFAMQQAAAEACTMATRQIAARYRLEMREKVAMFRNEKFALKSIVVYPAKYKRSSGELRQMDDINSIVGVRKIGDKEHYLAMLEIGADKTGIPKLGGGVLIPMDSARTEEQRNRMVAQEMRLDGQYKFGGKIDLSRFAGNPRQQYAIMNSMARRGKLWITGNKNKQIGKHAYYAVDQGDETWLYKITGDKAKIVRMIRSKVDIPAKPMFGESVSRVTQNDMETYFMRAAMILLDSLN